MTVLRRAAGAALLAAALAGCGIRPTTVPVDAGSAPTRARCGSENPPTPTAPREDGTEQLDVFLVCGAKVAPVRRNVERPQTDSAADVRATMERELLRELLDEPDGRESADGYDTNVDRLAIISARSGDPAEAVRFNREPQELSKQALAQLVCTYAGLGGGTRAVLGARGELRVYDCTPQVQEDPLRVQEGSRVYED